MIITPANIYLTIFNFTRLQQNKKNGEKLGALKALKLFLAMNKAILYLCSFDLFLEREIYIDGQT
jgi:hypothetical protein